MQKDTPLTDIPDKIYFRIGEVSRLLGVDAHVLRFWETEFASIKPFRGKSKQRLYRRQDVESLFQVKRLLHEEGYTIAGAKKAIFSASVVSQETIKMPATALGQNEKVDKLFLAQQSELLAALKEELLVLHKLLMQKY